jgi:predicted  nucleic acid-binding Zn-ribbon protein
MQLTGSISRGKTAEKHNTRECYRTRTPENIDRTRTRTNVVLENRTLEGVYAELFGAAAEAYNARQVEKGHPERQIPDYLEKVRNDKKLKPMYEFVVQVGNIDEQADAGTARAIYEDWLAGFRERYGEHFAVKQAIIHMDEATPHMHVEVVPVAESKRGLAVQNSLNKAISQCGFSDYKAMLAGWDEVLTAAMAAHGIERVAGDKEKQMGGVNIDTYRRTKRATEKLEERKAELVTQIADKEGDLADLDNKLSDVQMDIDEQAERLERLRQEVEEREMEPARETVAESAGALWKGRGAGSREDALAAEIEGLKSQIKAAEDEVSGLERGIEDLERELPSLRDRHSRLAERFDVAERRVIAAIERLREVPNIVSEMALGIAKRLGKRVYDPNSLDYQMRAATRAAEAWNRDHAASRSCHGRAR